MLIPISHEEQRVARLPWVTILLVAANVLVFLLTLPVMNQQSAESDRRLQEMLRFVIDHPYLQPPEGLPHFVPAKRPPADLSPEVIVEEQAHLDRLWNDFQAMASFSVYRRFGYIPAEPHLLALLTSMFMHAGWLHLIGNMLFLWLSGGSLEDRWGRVFFLLLYLVSGILATLMHAAMAPHSYIPLVGASGAIAGLMGAFLVRLAITRIRFVYWFVLFRGSFEAPAYLMLPLWLLQQLLMAWTRAGGGVAVWAHIGGFACGAAVAILVRLTDLEEKVLAPAIKKKTAWVAPDQLSAILEKLDLGDLDGATQDLEALLRAKPDDIEARTSLIEALRRKGDEVAAGKQSAHLVGVYLKARDAIGALAAARQHKQAYPDVPLPVHDQLAMAADCEKRQDYQEAAARYQDAIATKSDDPLAPKAMVTFARLLLRVFNEPAEAIEILKRACAHPLVTPELRQVSTDMIAVARKALPPTGGAWDVELETAPAPEYSPPPRKVPGRGEPVHEVPAAKQTPSLAPVPVRAVGINAYGLALQDRRGRTGYLPWQKVRAVSVASIGRPGGADRVAESLTLDLILASEAIPGDGRIRCVRLTTSDLAIPELQAEPSPIRAFQRLVATILKATGARPLPGREACLGLKGFPAFPHLAAYEADLITRLPVEQ